MAEAQEPQPLRLGTWGDKGGDAVGPEQEFAVVSYFGEDIHVVADPLSLELTLEEFIEVASLLEGEEDIRALAAVRKFLRTMIRESDFEKFWRLVRENRQGITEQMAFGKWIVEEMTGHPTARLSDSSDGQPSSTPRSEGGSSSRAQRRLEQAGRPDLAVAVLQRREHVEAQRGA